MKKYAGRFAGKVLVVTGAARGIGQTGVLRIAHEGGSLALVDRSPLVDGRENPAPCARSRLRSCYRYAADTRARLAYDPRHGKYVRNIGGV
jgi:NAD(P)-dependent dehydrogenase (short-subunit alcohol dehydrogenase family)